MGDAQMRAAFDFSGLGGPLHQRRPRSETSVTHMRELWVVRKIEEDGVGPLITCKRPQPEASSRAEPTHFFVVPSDEHVAPEIEYVVRRKPRHWVIAKIGVGAEISRREQEPRRT